MDLDQEKDYYEVLNIKDKATADEIKKAYRKLSMVHHPDKNQGNLNASTHKFQEISAAYEILGNVQKRKMYDLKKNNPIFHMLHHGTTCKTPNDDEYNDDEYNNGQGLGDLLAQLFTNLNSDSGGAQSLF